jgi:cyclophilin family peptidyl-prolyl cis-trans isomerase
VRISSHNDLAQQTKRRRKRYNPGSANAADVRPRGIFAIFGNVRLFFILGAAIMLGSLGVGGLYGSTLLTGAGGHQNTQGFNLPDDEDGQAPDAPAEEDALANDVRQYVAPPSLTIDPAGRYVATLMTENGDIEIELFADRAPQAVNNFLFLARDGFYDGLPFHVVFPGFSAQAGDPTGTGAGGPGYELPQEAPAPFKRGFVGMANASQFFIALTGSEQFEGYTPFGRVIMGLDVAERLQAGDVIRSVDITETAAAGPESGAAEDPL